MEFYMTLYSHPWVTYIPCIFHSHSCMSSVVNPLVPFAPQELLQGLWHFFFFFQPRYNTDFGSKFWTKNGSEFPEPFFWLVLQIWYSIIHDLLGGACKAKNQMVRHKRPSSPHSLTAAIFTYSRFLCFCTQRNSCSKISVLRKMENYMKLWTDKTAQALLWMGRS